MTWSFLRTVVNGPVQRPPCLLGGVGYGVGRQEVIVHSRVDPIALGFHNCPCPTREIEDHQVTRLRPREQPLADRPVEVPPARQDHRGRIVGPARIHRSIVAQEELMPSVVPAGLSEPVDDLLGASNG